MELFKMRASTLFVAALGLLALPEISAEPPHVLPHGVSSFAVFITLGLLCLALGLGLRSFSKAPSDLSINQPKK